MGLISFIDDRGFHDDPGGDAFLYDGAHVQYRAGIGNGGHDFDVNTGDVSIEGDCVDGDPGTRPIPGRDG